MGDGARRVLITGGTGYFGQALARHLLAKGDQVCCLSRSESKQAELRRKLDGIKWMVGDVRDRLRVRRAMRDCDLVVHAAALKRIEVGHENPGEMVQTNVNGTQHVVEEAEIAGIRCVVLSTDKAWKPVSAYGYSKALAECLALASGAAVVRYGNVMGSTGSIIPAWRDMINHGAHQVPVTDPGCTRFWMEVSDAVGWVMQVAEGETNEVHVADWLPAFRVADLATALGVAMDVRGLPSHEKLHEGMADGITSDVARRMTVEEIRGRLKYV